MIDLVAEQSALGGLERWLHDPAITEVLVNAGSQVSIAPSNEAARIVPTRVSRPLRSTQA